MAISIRKDFRNPSVNWQINPTRNWQINPLRNWQINPARNWKINPLRNWQINPARNWKINPLRNWQINPARNWKINPLLNWEINPLKNINASPFNPTFCGLYVISTAGLTCDFYLIKTEIQNVMLGYDEANNLSFLLVGENKVFSIYTMALEYVGFLCHNSQEGYNWFDLGGNWLYFVV